ncbi:hypothetical protein JW796_01105 [Candidatus Dojkabacteria bacterium]|nr:hypothetical protein [Candidatus Dojkabacteria bacterium]
MGIPNPSAIKAEIKGLESQKRETISAQKEQIQSKLSELLDNRAKLQARIKDLQSKANDRRYPPQVKAQIREQISTTVRQKDQLDAMVKRLYAQRNAVEMQVGGRYDQAILARRNFLTRLAGMQISQAVGDEVKGRKG